MELVELMPFVIKEASAGATAHPRWPMQGLASCPATDPGACHLRWRIAAAPLQGNCDRSDGALSTSPTPDLTAKTAAPNGK